MQGGDRILLLVVSKYHCYRLIGTKSIVLSKSVSSAFPVPIQNAAAARPGYVQSRKNCTYPGRAFATFFFCDTTTNAVFVTAS